MTTRIGIIGVGLMGHGIATSLQRHSTAQGWTLGFLEHAGNRPTESLVARGARCFSTGQALAAQSDVVIVCVTGSSEVADVLTRPDGVLSGLRPGCTVIDCSTSIPDHTRELAQQVEAAQGRFLDAPMTRTPKEAAEGRLNLIVGGEKAVFEEMRPILEAFSENICFAGGIGAGHSLKLLHNFVSVGFSGVLAEAVACAQRGGIDMQVLHEVLAQGGGAGAILQRFAPQMLHQDPSHFLFSLANCQKDIRYYRSMSESIHQSINQSINQSIDQSDRDDLAVNETAVGGAMQGAMAQALGAMLDAAVEAGHAAEPVPALVDILAARPEGN